MRVGWVGAGKLGLPCALALDHAEHDVLVTDVNREVETYLDNRKVPYREVEVDELLRSHRVGWRDTVAEIVEQSDMVFVAVQTPHAPHHDGTHPLGDDRADFEYAYLTQAVREVIRAAHGRPEPLTVVIVSTVLPGTFGRLLRPLTTPHVRLIYNPFFIAMGTTVLDFRAPEFVLVGADDRHAVEPLERLYRSLHDADVFVCSIETAELTKVAYNTFIGLKVAFGNLMGELCHKTGADVDDLVDALGHATDRIVSTKYLRAGMGDGGGCHPRDNLALSFFARRLDLHHDLFATLMEAREQHSAWLAEVVKGWCDLTGLPFVLLGKAYKPETDLTVGSPAALLARQAEPSLWWDPHVDEVEFHPAQAVYLVATKHPEFADLGYPRGSVVIDPFGYINDRDGVTVVRIGRKR